MGEAQLLSHKRSGKVFLSLKIVAKFNVLDDAPYCHLENAGGGESWMWMSFDCLFSWRAEG